MFEELSDYAAFESLFCQMGVVYDMALWGDDGSIYYMGPCMPCTAHTCLTVGDMAFWFNAGHTFLGTYYAEVGEWKPRQAEVPV